MKNIPLTDAMALLESCPLAMLIEEQGCIGYFNRAFAELLGAAAAGVVRGAAPDPMITPLLQANSLLNWIMPDGTERWFAIETVAPGDRPELRLHFYHDRTEQLRLKKERDELTGRLESQSMRDVRLPGLLSQYGLRATLEPMVSRCRRYNHPLSVVAMSLVTNPQDAREDAVRKVAHMLKDQTRWADLIGCNEGQDFILVLQETTQDAAMQLVEKLAAHVNELGESLDATMHTCFGITQCQKNDDAEALLERAEAALLEARNNDSGRSIAM